MREVCLFLATYPSPRVHAPSPCIDITLMLLRTVRHYKVIYYIPMYIRLALIIILCSDLQPEDPVYLSNQDQSTDVTFYEQVSNYLCNFTNQKNIPIRNFYIWVGCLSRSNSTIIYLISRNRVIFL